MKQQIKKLIGKSGASQLRSLQTSLKGFYLGFGNEVECPICNHTFSKFLNFRHRTNALCPQCRSLERHRLIHLHLRDKTNFFTTPKRILHFAPEKCWHAQFKANPLFQYETADYMVSFMDNIGARPDHVMSIDDIKFPDNSFDVVIAIGILLLVPDDHKAISELHRVLKPGGYAVLEDPIRYDRADTEEYDLSTPEAKAESRRKFGHLQYRYYGIDDYKMRIEQHGFRLLVDYYGESVDAHRYGIIPSIPAKIAYKS
jgi:SAM-dependent methyltransferase